MTWTPVVITGRFKGYVIEVYERMDVENSWGVRIFEKSYRFGQCGERRIDGCSLIRAKKIGKKLVLKHRKLRRAKK